MNALRSVRGVAGIGVLAATWWSARRIRRRTRFEEPAATPDRSTVATVEFEPEEEELTSLAAVVADALVLGRKRVRLDDDGEEIRWRLRVERWVKRVPRPKPLRGRSGEIQWKSRPGARASRRLTVVRPAGNARGWGDQPKTGERHRFWLASDPEGGEGTFVLLAARMLPSSPADETP